MKTALITGASSGIGKQTALALAKLEYRLILVARDLSKGQRAVDEIKSQFPETEVSFTSLDTTHFDSVREFADKLRSEGQPIDVMVLNAGLFTPKLKLSKSGHEYMFAATHLGHFLLTHELLALLKRSNDPRIVVTSSVAHWAGYFTDFFKLKSVSSSSLLMAAPFASYGRSKLANLLFVRGFDQRVPGVKINAFHPGAVQTDIWRDTPSLFQRLIGPMLVTEQQGASTQIWLASSPDLTASGEYFVNKKKALTSPLSQKAAMIDGLWDYSLSELGINKFGEPE